jgi:uncharacterized protein (TIGR00369 family)
MENDGHYRALERMYLAAPINEIYHPRIEVFDERAEIEIQVSRTLYHAAEAVHGSVYFKMLDDAAFFAANSIETEYFLLTASFTTYLIRPVASGRMKSIGRVVSKTRTQIIAEAVVSDGQGKDLGRGSGVFVRSKIPLVSAVGYAES